MVAYICATCGVQHEPSDEPPDHCVICEDERQYVGWSGQRWTTLEELRAGHKNEIHDDLGLTGVGTKPAVAIGQRALLVQAAEGNQLWNGMSLIRAGGHFDGGTVMHWPGGAEGRGALLAGDLLQVAQDRRWVSFMYSYPNYIPLPASEIDRIVAAVEPFAFDRIYGAWWDRNVASDAKAAVHRSAERYKKALTTRL